MLIVNVDPSRLYSLMMLVVKKPTEEGVKDIENLTLLNSAPMYSRKRSELEGAAWINDVGDEDCLKEENGEEKLWELHCCVEDHMFVWLE
ncbi:hypothetical protein FNV43_RR04221 [Rhamnella rubrinervis]|uniref:Uncharacterized protein n=1 Tax=Rhamnella rubrinervis TaxID=2594499 RepID=A0A8K0HLC0_9ROSA|nr:hypothetical protein FNV43_RR04221 [Rhamnella rubrinervis]